MRRATKENFLMSIIGITFFLNIVVINFVTPIIEELLVVGWIILGIGAVLIVLSIGTLRRKGTSRIIDSGVYGIVRHPMYVGGMAMFFSHFF